MQLMAPRLYPKCMLWFLTSGTLKSQCYDFQAQQQRTCEMPVLLPAPWPRILAGGNSPDKRESERSSSSCTIDSWRSWWESTEARTATADADVGQRKGEGGRQRVSLEARASGRAHASICLGVDRRAFAWAPVPASAHACMCACTPRGGQGGLTCFPRAECAALREVLRPAAAGLPKPSKTAGLTCHGHAGQHSPLCTAPEMQQWGIEFSSGREA